MTRPEMMGEPRPPAPMVAPIVAVPILTMTEVRRPARIRGAARGSSILKRIRVLPMPIPRAASRTSGPTPASPLIVLRTMGRMP